MWVPSFLSREYNMIELRSFRVSKLEIKSKKIIVMLDK